MELFLDWICVCILEARLCFENDRWKFRRLNNSLLASLRWTGANSVLLLIFTQNKICVHLKLCISIHNFTQTFRISILCFAYAYNFHSLILKTLTLTTSDWNGQVSYQSNTTSLAGQRSRCDRSAVIKELLKCP